MRTIMHSAGLAALALAASSVELEIERRPRAGYYNPHNTSCYTPHVGAKQKAKALRKMEKMKAKL